MVTCRAICRRRLEGPRVRRQFEQMASSVPKNRRIDADPLIAPPRGPVKEITTSSNPESADAEKIDTPQPFLQKHDYFQSMHAEQSISSQILHRHSNNAV